MSIKRIVVSSLAGFALVMAVSMALAGPRFEACMTKLENATDNYESTFMTVYGYYNDRMPRRRAFPYLGINPFCRVDDQGVTDCSQVPSSRVITIPPFLGNGGGDLVWWDSAPITHRFPPISTIDNPRVTGRAPRPWLFHSAVRSGGS